MFSVSIPVSGSDPPKLRSEDAAGGWLSPAVSPPYTRLLPSMRESKQRSPLKPEWEETFKDRGYLRLPITVTSVDGEEPQ